MDSTYLLVSDGFILEELPTAQSALEIRDFMRLGHPGQSFDLLADG